MIIMILYLELELLAEGAAVSGWAIRCILRGEPLWTACLSAQQSEPTSSVQCTATILYAYVHWALILLRHARYVLGWLESVSWDTSRIEDSGSTCNVHGVSYNCQNTGSLYPDHQILWHSVLGYCLWPMLTFGRQVFKAVRIRWW